MTTSNSNNRDAKTQKVHGQIERYSSAVKLYDWTPNEFLDAVVNAVYASRCNDYPNHEDIDAITALVEKVFADSQTFEAVGLS